MCQCEERAPRRSPCGSSGYQAVTGYARSGARTSSGAPIRSRLQPRRLMSAPTSQRILHQFQRYGPAEDFRAGEQVEGSTFGVSDDPAYHNSAAHFGLSVRLIFLLFCLSNKQRRRFILSCSFRRQPTQEVILNEFFQNGQYLAEFLCLETFEVCKCYRFVG